MLNKTKEIMKNLFKNIEELFSTGNKRKIIIKDQNGESYIEIPLLIALIITVAAPVVTLIGFFAGIAAGFSMETAEKKKRKIILVNEKEI
jgi:hypothetical protein